MRLAILLLLSAVAAAQPSFVNYESALVHPVRVSADGTRLYAVNAPDNRLAVYDLADPSHPVLVREVPVGLEPVSVTERSAGEVWVVNGLSDSVSVVSIPEGRVVATLRVKDEPADVAFAAGKAFVTASASDKVVVFDAATRQPLGEVAVFGKDPRALAVDPAGTTVYVLVHRSGNRSVIVPENQAPAPPPPSNPALPPAPSQGVIVDATDPAYQAAIPQTLPDVDLVAIDVQTLAVSWTASGIGTVNFDLAVDPATGDVFVANTDARNLVRFEPVVRGHAIDSRVTRVSPGMPPAVTAFDLNPGFDYLTLPNPAAQALALAEPTGIARSPLDGRLFVAAQGTDRIGILDAAGGLLGRVELGAAGSNVDTLNKRGPRGLAHHPTLPRLYVLNRLSLSLAVVDTAAGALLLEQPLPFDPTPAAVKSGRRFLYDAKLSGNGTMSCASCHVDGDVDGLAWDLGNPAGSLEAAPAQPFPFNIGITSFHPMKGPMTTQTLKGLAGLSPFHWRGDRASLAAFNPAFSSLMGGTPLGAAELSLFTTFLESTAFPPNPNQNLDRSYATTPANANAATGLAAFQTSVVNILPGTPFSCATCHALPAGTNRMVINAQIIQAPQQMKVPELRNLYRKNGALRAPGSAKSGFGFTHDGALDTLAAFLALPVFNPWPSSTKDDIVAFLMAFDTGTAPAVGYQATADAGNAMSAAVTADLALLESQAAAGNCALVVKGVLDGRPRGLLFQPATGTYLGDGPDLGPLTANDLRTQALLGQAIWTFTGVAPGTGTRIGIDRDQDGTPDAEEGLVPYGAATPGCALALDGNSEPRAGNAGFALVVSGAAPTAAGLVGFSAQPAALPLLGMTILIDVASPTFFLLPLAVRPSGFALLEIPLPPDPQLVGLSVNAQAVMLDPCGPAGFAATNGLEITIRP